MANPEKDAYERLGLLRQSHGKPYGVDIAEPYSPAKAKEGDYSRKLKEDLKALDAKGLGELEPARRAQAAEQLERVRRTAGRVTRQGLDPLQRRVAVREAAQAEGLRLRDQEFDQLLAEAKRQAQGSAELIGPGQALDFAPVPWLWRGVLIGGAINLLIGLPKVGKTALLLGMLGAWTQGRGQFLGQELIGRCPPVLIVGTDQPQGDWGRMLQQAGLLNHDHTLAHPIVGLAHSGAPLHLAAEGIERIAGIAAEHPGLLVVLDSYRACVSRLGVAEESSDFAAPLQDLAEAVAPYGATLAVIHHSNKGRAGEGASLASRGTTALPALASQTISLDRLKASQPGATQDRRVTLRTEGRGGEPVQLLIERTLEGWICHGDGEAIARQQAMDEVEAGLSDRQADVLEAVRERWAAGQWADAMDIAAALGLGGDGERKARSTLDQLARKGLIFSRTESTGIARRKSYRPITDEGQGGGGGLSPDAPDAPNPPNYHRLRGVSIPVEPFREKGSEGREGKEASERGGSGTLRTPEAPRPWQITAPMTQGRFQITDGQRSLVVDRARLPEFGLAA